jgi:hypothetical protein
MNIIWPKIWENLNIWQDLIDNNTPLKVDNSFLILVKINLIKFEKILRK